MADTECTALSLSACQSGAVQLDVVFVLDTSVSGNDDTIPGMVIFMLNVLINFVMNAEIGSNAIQVGLQTFSDTSLTVFNLNDFNIRNDVLDTIASLFRVVGGTFGNSNTGGWN